MKPLSLILSLPNHPIWALVFRDFKKSENQTELRAALKLAFKYDSRVLVEQGVNAREISWAAWKHDVKVPCQVKVKDVAFYDCDAKYIDNKITIAIPVQLDLRLENHADQRRKSLSCDRWSWV